MLWESTHGLTRSQEHHLANIRLQAFNYNAKQSRRWIRARLLSNADGSISKDVASQLAKHFEKTEFQLKHPRITDTVLTDAAKRVLSELQRERDTARDEQGYPERVRDWWTAPTVPGKKKRKKGMTMATEEGATAGLEVSDGEMQDAVRRLRLGEEEEEMEEEEGIPFLEEGLEGFDSPVMLSPEGSVVGDGDEEDEE